MVRLSLDVIRWRRGTSSVVLPREDGDEIEALRSQLLELVIAGRDVVLDLSLWSRQLREEYRRLLEPTGVVPETVYLATDQRPSWIACGHEAAATLTMSSSPQNWLRSTSTASSRPPARRAHSP